VPLDLLVRDTLTGIKLSQPGVDLREEHQPFDRVVERGVVRQILESFEDALTRSGSRHTTAILAPITPFGRRVPGHPRVGRTLGASCRTRLHDASPTWPFSSKRTAF
jgi:hypothetical protein